MVGLLDQVVLNVQDSGYAVCKVERDIPGVGGRRPDIMQRSQLTKFSQALDLRCVKRSHSQGAEANVAMDRVSYVLRLANSQTEYCLAISTSFGEQRTLPWSRSEAERVG